jgi:hypothetical protein
MCAFTDEDAQLLPLPGLSQHLSLSETATSDLSQSRHKVRV